MALVSILQLVHVIRSKFLIVVLAGNVGVVEELGEVKEEVLKPGIHFMNPVADVVEFSTRLKNVQEHIEATSKEGLDIKVHVS